MSRKMDANPGLLLRPGNLHELQVGMAVQPGTPSKLVMILPGVLKRRIAVRSRLLEQFHLSLGGDLHG